MFDNMSYYTGRTGKQCFDFIEEFSLNFNLGNVAKYICRCGKKGRAIDDLYKARSYIQREIDRIINEEKEGKGE